MEDDLTHAYLEKMRRDALASKFAQEMQTPDHNPHRDHIDEDEVEALAIAIERSTPDQVALWIKTLLDWACDDDSWEDDVTWNDGSDDEAEAG